MPLIAMSTHALGHLCTARQGIDFAVAHGIRGLELGSYALWSELMTVADIAYVRRTAAASGAEVSVHYTHVDTAPGTHDRDRRLKHLRDLEDTLRLAHDLGGHTVVLHPGAVDYPGMGPNDVTEVVRGEAQRNLVRFLETAVRTAEQTGTVLCLENMWHVPGQVILTYGELLDVVASVDSPHLQVTLDTGHADLFDGIAPAIETFGTRLRHIHLHDCDGQQDHQEIGAGHIDFQDLQTFLASFPYTIVIESRDDTDNAGSLLRGYRRLRDLIGPAAR